MQLLPYQFEILIQINNTHLVIYRFQNIVIIQLRQHHRDHIDVENTG